MFLVKPAHHKRCEIFYYKNFSTNILHKTIVHVDKHI